jgi:hypothetical protein
LITFLTFYRSLHPSIYQSFSMFSGLAPQQSINLSQCFGPARPGHRLITPFI